MNRRNKNNEIGGINEMTSSTNTASGQPMEVVVVQDTIQGTIRSIGLGNVFNELGISYNFSREQGTPQKRLHDLLYACRTIVSHNSDIFKGKITKLDVEGLITELKKVGREDMFKSIEDRNLFCEYIDLFISSLKSTSQQIKKNKIFISVWLLVLVKSMSDISQCGSLINDILELYEGGNIPNIGKLSGDTRTDVLSVLNSNKNVTFVSSDKICAALSTNILKLIDYPIQTLCSRKTGTTTQTMIIQKEEVSALSVVLSVVGDEEKSIRLINDIIYYDSSDINKKEVVNMVIYISGVVTDYYTRILDNYKRNNIENKNIILQDIIQLQVDSLFYSKDEEYENENAQRKLCELIYKISLIDNLKENLRMLSYVLSSKDNFEVHRWTYHISNDVFKYMFPLTQQRFKGSELKNKISIEEILSATADAMYGHDFALSCITDLGRAFLTAVGEADVYNIDNDLSYSKKEDLCISQTLQLNHFSTINQHGDKFSINFNSDSNYLVVDRKEMFYRNSEIPWNITASPLINQAIIASVDFVSGEPSISVVLSEQVNLIKQRNIRKQQVLAFSVLTQSEDLAQKLIEIEKNTNYREYNGVTTLYDGAAPYGGLPIYKLDQYVSSMNIALKPSKKERVDEENITLTVTTNTTETEEILRSNWASERIRESGVDYFENTLIPNVVTPNVVIGLSEEQKEQLSKPPRSSPLYKFNLIWGTILNSKSKMTQQFRKEIFGEFNSVVTEIQNKIEQLNEGRSERSRRASTQQPMSRFFPNFKNTTEYSIFDDDMVQEQIKKIYEAVDGNENKSLEKFDVMMIEYFKILTGSDTDDKTKETLLTILEVAVRTCKVCSDDPDGIFKSLLSYNKMNQITDVDQQLKEIMSRAEENIRRNKDIQRMKQVYLQEVSTKRGQSNSNLDFSTEHLITTPKSKEHKEQYTPASVQSAFAVPYSSTSDWARRVANDSQVSEFTETLDDTFFNENDLVSRQGSQNTDYDGFDIVVNSELGSPKKSDSPPLSPRSNVRKRSQLTDSNESDSRGEHTRSEQKTSSQDSDIEEYMSEGGSRKHHRVPHKSVTRRKNKNLPKRKTIKKRKMQKRNTKTRRNK